MTDREAINIHTISGEVLEVVGVSKESLAALLCTAAILAKTLGVPRSSLLRALMTAYNDDREAN